MVDDFLPFHKAIVMVMMGRGIMEKDDFIDNFDELKDHYIEHPAVVDAEVEPTLEKINEKLANYDFAISLTKYEYSGEEFYVFVSTTQSPENRFQNVYTHEEIQFFPALIKEIITTEEANISPIDVLNLSSKLETPITKGRAEELLEEWTDVGYFHRIDDMIFLGPRMLVEFNGYLAVHFADYIQMCFICKNTVYKALSCSASSCSVVTHSSCINRYHENFPNMCPSCKGKWVA
ncbi:non-structural maintenance of chromosomes element 1 homolog [Lutzomyia longipalpis]|uniref:non-structural maintenance of chromosomes element 1 homolog n=1 Tax=Lutzomyia longipalpis TaxID=7200 RepID=UPI0024844FC8|nr:non-structural maintenance of chromosomes element 1 homolog [Lutzomyia longipalpis]